MNRLGRKRQFARSQRYDLLLVAARLIGITPPARPKVLGGHHIAQLEGKIKHSRGLS